MNLKSVLLALLLALAPAAPALSDGNAGPYLAGRQAAFTADYAAASEFFTRALVRDPSNTELMESAMNAFVGLGSVDQAVPIARRLMQAQSGNQIAHLVLFADAVKREAWDAVLADLDAGQTVGPLFDGLLRAWALVGAGRMSDALEGFDAVSASPGVLAFGLYHKALALASAGDLEGADAIFSGTGDQALRLTLRGVLAHAQVLSQLERNEDALALLEQAFGPNDDPTLNAVKAQLTTGETLPLTVAGTAMRGIAEVHYTIAGALQGEASEAYTLIYARLVEYLAPDHIDGLLLVAELLENLEQYDLATAVYDQVPREDPAYPAAELGRADALTRSDKADAAIEVLRQLGETHGALPQVHVALGDALRRLERYDEATAPYDRAIDLYGDPQPNHWIVYFARGITHEREDRWPLAEADFRQALELRPDQPQVLNYLGYSMVEMNINLDEALDMIQRAVAGQPDSGYIVDSLGWVLYRRGEYQEAVVHMERAVELLPIDPVINDHLGDVYWAVGRWREAEFQWHRALSFDPEPEDAARIRRKLEVGLDVVLDEEGAPPLKVANDG